MEELQEEDLGARAQLAICVSVELHAPMQMRTAWRHAEP